MYGPPPNCKIAISLIFPRSREFQCNPITLIDVVSSAILPKTLASGHPQVLKSESRKLSILSCPKSEPLGSKSCVPDLRAWSQISHLAGQMGCRKLLRAGRPGKRLLALQNVPERIPAPKSPFLIPSFLDLFFDLSWWLR